MTKIHDAMCIATILVVALLLAGCGGGSGDEWTAGVAGTQGTGGSGGMAQKGCAVVIVENRMECER